jgi:hypothetical protein
MSDLEGVAANQLIHRIGSRDAIAVAVRSQDGATRLHAQQRNPGAAPRQLSGEQSA